MSGGSFNYLARRLEYGEVDPVALVRDLEDMKARAGRMSEAEMTRAIDLALDEARAALVARERFVKRYKTLLHAVEWDCSGDTVGEGQAEAIKLLALLAADASSPVADMTEVAK